MAYEKSAEYYDAIYSFKDYASESEKILVLVEARLPEARTLLDVACGTGKHLSFLRERFLCQGVDLSPDFLRIASAANPELPFHQASFDSFRLSDRFDVVTCLFSAIGYAADVATLERAVACMADHLNPGGLLIVEPWILPEDFIVDGRTHAMFTDRPNLKIARMCISEVVDGRAILDMHHLVGDESGIHSFVERHELTLFSDADYRSAFRQAGLEVEFLEGGLTGRGLYVGVNPKSEG